MTLIVGQYGTCISNRALTPILDLVQFPSNGEVWDVNMQNKVSLCRWKNQYWWARKAWKEWTCIPYRALTSILDYAYFPANVVGIASTGGRKIKSLKARCFVHPPRGKQLYPLPHTMGHGFPKSGGQSSCYSNQSPGISRLLLCWRVPAKPDILITHFNSIGAHHVLPLMKFHFNFLHVILNKMF